MNKITSLLLTVFLLQGCASLSNSLILGGVTGLAVGAASGSFANPGKKGEYTTQNITLGAAVGVGAGLLAAYLLHRNTEQMVSERVIRGEPQVFYGDLPPNPFEISPNLNLPIKGVTK